MIFYPFADPLPIVLRSHPLSIHSRFSAPEEAVPICKSYISHAARKKEHHPVVSQEDHSMKFRKPFFLSVRLKITLVVLHIPKFSFFWRWQFASKKKKTPAELVDLVLH